MCQDQRDAERSRRRDGSPLPRRGDDGRGSGRDGRERREERGHHRSGDRSRERSADRGGGARERDERRSRHPSGDRDRGPSRDRGRLGTRSPDAEVRLFTVKCVSASSTRSHIETHRRQANNEIGAEAVRLLHCLNNLTPLSDLKTTHHLPKLVSACSSARCGGTVSATATAGRTAIKTAMMVSVATVRIGSPAVPRHPPRGPRKRVKCIRWRNLSWRPNRTMVRLLGRTGSRTALLRPLRLQIQRFLAVHREQRRRQV